MKKLLLLSIASIGFMSSLNAQVTTYAVGDVVSDFTVTDVNGYEHSLYEITATGKYVFLDFFFDTCPPCQATSPIFGAFYDKYGCNEGDIYCLAVNNGTDSDAEVVAFEDEFGGDGNHAPAVSTDGGGGDVTTAFGVGAFPTYCVVGPDNKLYSADIWPIDNIESFEAVFGGDLNPDPMPCSASASLDEETSVSNLNIYPNPANAIASIVFSSEKDAEATITVYNMLGEVVEANNTQVVAGTNTQEISVENYETGNYIVQIQLGDAIITSKLEVIK